MPKTETKIREEKVAIRSDVVYSEDFREEIFGPLESDLIPQRKDPMVIGQLPYILRLWTASIMLMRRNGISDPDPNSRNTRSSSTIGSNGEGVNRMCIQRQWARTELRNQSYRFRTARAWNLLPNNVQNAKSTNSFKNGYESWKLKSQSL